MAKTIKNNVKKPKSNNKSKKSKKTNKTTSNKKSKEVKISQEDLSLLEFKKKKSFSVATSLSEIIHLFKKNSEIDFCVNELEARDVDRDSYWLDTTKAQKLLNWKPRIFLHEGIKEILK